MKKGFTLAEVMVTLAVIGVVAALAIPALMQNTNDAQFKTAWKKAFSDLNQAANLIISENGSLKGLSESYVNAFADKMNIVKKCDVSYIGGCWHGDNEWSSLTASNSKSYSPAFIGNNGMLYLIMDNDPTCNLIGWRETPNGKGICSRIIVDVNGFKKPNIVSKDIFQLWVQDDRVAPAGIPDDVYYTNFSCPDNPGEGYVCSAKYLKN